MRLGRRKHCPFAIHWFVRFSLFEPDLIIHLYLLGRICSSAANLRKRAKRGTDAVQLRRRPSGWAAASDPGDRGARLPAADDREGREGKLVSPRLPHLGMDIGGLKGGVSVGLPRVGGVGVAAAEDAAAMGVVVELGADDVGGVPDPPVDLDPEQHAGGRSDEVDPQALPQTAPAARRRACARGSCSCRTAAPRR